MDRDAAINVRDVREDIRKAVIRDARDRALSVNDTVGEILVRAHTARRWTGEAPTFVRTFDASQVPHLAAVGDRWPALAAQDIYPQGLRTFVDGLLTQATSATSGGESA